MSSATTATTTKAGKIKKKKPSGAAWRRLKREREAKERKLQEEGQNIWIVTDPKVDTEHDDLVEVKEEAIQSDDSNQFAELVEVQINTEEVFESRSNLEDENEDFQYNDPATWPFIDEGVRNQLIRHGPEQDMRDPVTVFNSISGTKDRRFSLKWYTRILPDGSKEERRWMLYSRSRNVVFCFCCILFSTTKKSSFADINKGFYRWQKLCPAVPEHEQSPEHNKCFALWQEIEEKLRKEKEIEENLKTENEKKKSIFKSIVHAILFCARINLPLNDVTDQSGIFFSTLELISRYHPQLADHLKAAKSSPGSEFLFSSQFIDQLICLVCEKVRSEIISRAKKAKYYSILFDNTEDQKISRFIRYVHIDDGQCSIEESFIDLIEMDQSSERTNVATIHGLDISDCRAQAYDNSSHMTKRYEQLQSEIQTLNQYARNVPNLTHPIVLVALRAAEKSSTMIQQFFYDVNKVFRFVLEHLKHLIDSNTEAWRSESCWSINYDAMRSLSNEIQPIYKSLSEDECGASSEVEDILEKIDLKFLCCLDLWCQVLAMLQTFDSSNPMEMKSLLDSLQNLKETGIPSVVEKARSLAKNLGIEFDFQTARKRQRMSSEEDDFEMECCSILKSLIDRFKWISETLSEISSDFGFLNGKALTAYPVEELRKCATDLALKYNSDLNPKDFATEIATFKDLANTMVTDLELVSPLQLLQLIQTYSMEDAFPNIFIAIRMFLTINVEPISSSMRKLKLVGDHLKSSENKNISILSIESQIANSLDFDDLFKSCPIADF